MQNITNISFNFGLMEDIIVERLKEYNISRDDYLNGFGNSDLLKEKAESLFEAINCCDGFIGVRKSMITKQLLERKGLDSDEASKDGLIYENKYLLGQLKWHKKLKDSISKDCKRFIDAEFGFDEEPDIN